MKIHFVGIGGIAMGNLAFMLKELGHEITGSDQNLYPPMSTQLEKWNLHPKSGFDSKHVLGADLVVIGNAISRGNPEVEEVLNSRILYMSMAECIQKFLLKDKKVIVVSGTHGKTTTTFLIHYILSRLGLDPGLFVGGIRKDGFPGFAIGKGEYFVIEGDEYDSAFFDKSSKFLHYEPYYLLMTALDFDHADIFRDVDAIKLMFSRLLKLVPSKGKVWFQEKSKHLKEVTDGYTLSRLEPYSLNEKSSLLHYKKGIVEFQKKRIHPNIFGNHNMLNAEVALKVCLEIAPTKTQEILKAFEEFPGVKRRQEILHTSEKSVLMEDFAHHPVAIHETILAVKNHFPDHKIISLFEPRSATSHRNVFQKDFAKSFAGSSSVVITEIYNPDKVPKKERLNVKRLVSDTKKLSKADVHYAKNPEHILEILDGLYKKYSSKKIIVLAMSNGAFGGIYPKLITSLKKRDL